MGGFFGGGGASVDLASPPAIGNTTPNTGKFTTVESTSRQFITTVDGSIQIGRDGGNTLGARAVNIQTGRESFPARVASGTESVAIGYTCQASGNTSIAIGRGALATGANASMVIGNGCNSSADYTCNISTDNVTVNASGATAINPDAYTTHSIRDSFTTRTFLSVYWSGTTTNATADQELIIGGGGSARLTIGANTFVMADLWIGANSTGAGKALFARRCVAIRRDGSNNTSLVGAVQTIGTDQNTGSPTWTFTVDADDTNEALRIRVTGAASETVVWRVVGFCRSI